MATIHKVKAAIASAIDLNVEDIAFHLKDDARLSSALVILSNGFTTPLRRLSAFIRTIIPRTFSAKFKISASFTFSEPNTNSETDFANSLHASKAPFINSPEVVQKFTKLLNALILNSSQEIPLRFLKNVFAFVNTLDLNAPTNELKTPEIPVILESSRLLIIFAPSDKLNLGILLKKSFSFVNALVTPSTIPEPNSLLAKLLPRSVTKPPIELNV